MNISIVLNEKRARIVCDALTTFRVELEGAWSPSTPLELQRIETLKITEDLEDEIRNHLET